jgi:ribosomal protein S18 acetylase RimI-like enzyme
LRKPAKGKDPMKIRKLTADDAALFRNLRLEGLKNHPEAFGESYDEFAANSVEQIAGRIPADPASRAGFVLGAFDEDGAMAGVVALGREHRRKRSHKAVLWGMYVIPAYRRQGVASRLVRRLLEYARAFGDVEQIVLTAATRNERAVRLYESLGFRSYGREPRALQIDGDYYDQEHMYLVL